MNKPSGNTVIVAMTVILLFVLSAFTLLFLSAKSTETAIYFLSGIAAPIVASLSILLRQDQVKTQLNDTQQKVNGHTTALTMALQDANTSLVKNGQPPIPLSVPPNPEPTLYLGSMGKGESK